MTNVIGTTDAAKILDVTTAYVRILAESGRLPARKIGQSWVFSRADVEGFTPAPRGNPNFVAKPKKKRPRPRNQVSN
jgi:excisionase family DNA binding protein